MYTENGTDGKRQFLFVCCKRKTELNYIYVYITVIYVYAAISNKKQNKESQTIFLNPFTVCSSSK